MSDGQDADSLRAALEAALDDVIALRGRTSPLAQILSHALLRGDPKTMSATLAFCRNGGDSVRLRPA
jgi:hypothetical protein